MTIQEIAQLPYVVMENVENKFYHLTVTDDHYITAYHDGDDILTYLDTNDAYFPLGGIFPEYRTITGEQHREYEYERDHQPEENNE